MSEEKTAEQTEGSAADNTHSPSLETMETAVPVAEEPTDTVAEEETVQADEATEGGEEEFKTPKKEIKLVDAEKIVGKMITLWLEERQEPALVRSVDKDKQLLVAELQGETRKGEVYEGNYDANQTVDVYEPEDGIIVLCKTGTD